MAIRIALITLLFWVLALGATTWGEIRVLLAERDAEIAEIQYAEALVRRRIAEVEEFNRGLELHIETLQSSYPRVVKARKQNHATF